MGKTIAGVVFAFLAIGVFTLQADPLDVVSYTFSKDPSSSYDDPDRTKLTDGETVPDSWWSPGSPSPLGAEVGWIQNPANPDVPHPAITFDFGEGKYVDSVSINYVLWPDAGVRAPNEVRVSYSMNGEEFTGEEIFQGFDGSDSEYGYTMFTRNLTLDLDGMPARFVRLDFLQGPGDSWGPNRSSWHWFDEASFTGSDIDDLHAGAPANIYTAIELEFPTEVGRVYRIQRSADLEEWEDWGQLVLGNGEVFQLFRSIKTEGRGFFRVLTSD